MRNKILALYYVERKTWFFFPVEYNGENLFSPWSKIFVVVVRCSLFSVIVVDRRSCLIRVRQSHTSRMGLSYYSSHSIGCWWQVSKQVYLFIYVYVYFVLLDYYFSTKLLAFRVKPISAYSRFRDKYSLVCRFVPSSPWLFKNTVCVQSYGRTISKKSCSVPSVSRRTYRAKKRNVLTLRVVSYTRCVVLQVGRCALRCIP
jgi:hypothetical protein